MKNTTLNPPPSPQARCESASVERLFGRSVFQAGLTRFIRVGAFCLPARVRAEQTAEVARHDLGLHLLGHVEAALAAQQAATGHNVLAIEDGTGSACRTKPRLLRSRLALSAHGIANPASTRHRRCPSSPSTATKKAGTPSPAFLRRVSPAVSPRRSEAPPARRPRKARRPARRHIRS